MTWILLLVVYTFTIDISLPTHDLKTVSDLAVGCVAMQPQEIC